MQSALENHNLQGASEKALPEQSTQDHQYSTCTKSSSTPAITQRLLQQCRVLPAPCFLCSRRCNAGLRQVSRLTGLRLKLLHTTDVMTSLACQIAASSWGNLSRNRKKRSSLRLLCSIQCSVEFYAFSSALPMVLLCQPSLGWLPESLADSDI